MSFEEPTRCVPRLVQGRYNGGIYEGQANAADGQWAIACGLSLSKPHKRVVHLHRLSLRTWQREEAGVIARNHKAAVVVQQRHRNTVEAEKTMDFQRFASDLRIRHKRLGRVGLAHDKLVLTTLNEECVAIRCKHPTLKSTFLSP